MIPRIADKGHSFKGAGAYYLHDKGAQTDERVAWTHTSNLRTNDPEKALHVMAWTAMHSRELKNASGVSMAGAKQTTGAVYSYSLAWHPEQNPSREEMLQAGQDTLNRLGLSEHESMIVSHADTDHQHIHIIANLIHPETGKKHDPKLDKRILQKWASNYEKEHGKIYCPEREKNSQDRANAVPTKYQDQTLETGLDIDTLYHASDSGKAFKSALESEGLTLARGDKKRLVIVTQDGQIQNLSRQIKGMKTKDIKQKLSDLDVEQLPDANGVKQAREAAFKETQQDMLKKDEAKKEYAQKANALDQKKEREAREKKSALEIKPDFDQAAEQKPKFKLRRVFNTPTASFTMAASTIVPPVNKAFSKASGTATTTSPPPPPEPTPKQGRHDADLRKRQLNKMKDQHRDELIEFDQDAANKRHEENKKLDEFYGTKEAKRELRDAEKELKANGGFFARITGKTAKLSERVDVLKLNRESAERSRGYSMGKVNKQLDDQKKKILDKHKEEHRYFENSPTKKFGTAKVFEKAVLTKDKANQQQNQKTQDKDKGRDNGR